MAPFTIAAFGHFRKDEGRSWTIRTGLEERGYRVILCQTEAKGFIGKCRDLRRKWNALPEKPDVLLLSFLGHYLAPLAWLLARRARIPFVFDAFLSLYDTDVQDRKRFSRLDPRAWARWITDWASCRLADLVLLDTDEHARYFHDAFGVPLEKILVLPIGCRTDLFRPTERTAGEHDQFRVEFHGTFIPLQGIDTILTAAKELRERGETDIRFALIGKGQTYEPMRALAERWNLTNVRFPGYLSMEEIARAVADADVCLGIFGTTDKALRVIPNKAYETWASGKALITERSPASERVLADTDAALLTEPGNGHDLAEAILRLKRDPGLRERIGRNGRKLTEERFLPRTIVEPLVHWLRACLEKSS